VCGGWFDGGVPGDKLCVALDGLAICRDGPASNARSLGMRVLIVGFLLLLPCAFGQAPGPSFEIASVKVAVEPGPYHWDISPVALRMRNINLKQLVLTAYQVQDFQVDGGGGWTESERFDIDGKSDHETTRDELLKMLRTLLAERFHLTVAVKQRPTWGYSMTVAKTGLKIQPDPSEGAPSIHVMRAGMTVSRFPMGGLAGALSNILQIPVSDATGLEGRFGFSLQWRPDETRESGDHMQGSLSLPDALLDKTGLRLERARISIPVYVIEHAEKPAEN
jgi:uncharacterized protein (TIGR03435 family)